ncbi:YcaO-like family protein [Streptomyces sp. NPDC056601]|uniref:YcaO-like family protein n=1 Tax=Streptomyces sp. NPDC056601 TaxID=3345875 RepID=UPI0036848547
MVISSSVNSPSSHKVFTTGTHRVRSPEDTWEMISDRLSDYGVSRVADVTGLDSIGIPVAVAYRPLARTLSVSQGKGHSLLLAKISAVMESVEMWHAEFACPSPTHRRTAARDLHLPYRLNDLGRHRASLIGEATALDWIDATGSVSGQRIPVPRLSVELTSTAGQGWQPRGLLVSSNGLASGNSHAEASLHALYEVMERDALSQLSASPGDVRQNLLVPSITDPVTRPLIDRIHAAGVFLDVALVPNRWGIPCFVAFVWSEDFALLTAGSGAHSSVSVALSRAVTEAAQSRLTLINGSRDDVTASYDQVLRGSTKKPVTDPAAINFADSVADFHDRFDDIEDELRWACTAVADRTGMEPLTVDLSSTDAFSVVKVICPGLNNSTRHVVPRPDYSPAAT